MKFVIYKYTCPEGKHYIGITINTERRKEAHRKSGQSKRKRTKFTEAISKFGFDNLKYEEIEFPETVDEMKQREKYWIVTLDSKTNGYNSNDGGGWSRKFEHSAKKIETIISLLKEDKYTLDEISKIVKVSKSWVWAISHAKARNNTPISRTSQQSQKGSSNKSSKLTESQVAEIQSQLSQGVSRKELQQKYNVSKTLIQLIATNGAWSHVESDYQYKPRELNGNAKLTPEIVKDIKKDLETLTQMKVAEKYGISRATIQQIHSGRTWKNV